MTVKKVLPEKDLKTGLNHEDFSHRGIKKVQIFTGERYGHAIEKLQHLLEYLSVKTPESEIPLRIVL